MAATTELERLIVRLVGDATQYRKTLKEAEQVTKSAEQRFQTLARGITQAFTVASAVVGGLAVRAFAEFEDAIVKATAIMDVSEDTMRRMEQAAIDLSTTTTHAAKELGNAFLFLAQAGKSAEQSIALLPVVSNFAAAGNFDLARATDLATDAQSALGLASKNAAEDAKTLLRVTDVLTKAGTVSTASTQQFSEALTNKAGPALRSMNKEIEEGISVLATYAQQGIKGRQAGEMLARVLRILPKAARDSSEAHELLGFSVFDASGKMRDIADIVQNLESILGDMSDEMKSATLEALGFEVRIQQAILPLIGMSDQIKEFRNNMDDAGGTTERIAEKQLSSFSAQMKILKNNINAALIELGREFAPIVKAVANVIKEAIQWWNSLNSSVKASVAILATTALGLSALGLAIKAINGATLFAGLAFAKLTKGMGIASASVTMLRKAFAALIIVGVADYILGKVIPAFKEMTKAQEDAIAVNKSLIESQTKLNEQMLKTASDIAKPYERQRFLGDQLEDAKKRAEILKVELDDIKKHIEELDTVGHTILRNVPIVGRSASHDLEMLRIKMESLNEEYQLQTGHIDNITTALKEATDQANKFAKEGDKVLRAISKLDMFQGKLNEKIQEANKPGDVWEEAKRLWDEAKDAGVGLDRLDKLNEAVEKFQDEMNRIEYKNELRDLQDQTNAYIGTLRDEIYLLDLEARGIDTATDAIRKRRMESRTNALVAEGENEKLVKNIKFRFELVKKLYEESEALKKTNILRREAKELTERLLDPIQKYNKEVEHLKKLQPFLDPVTFDKAMKEAKDKLDALTESTKDARRELEMLDGVLFRSAEARSRIKDYADALRNVPDGTPIGSNKQVMRIINPLVPPAPPKPIPAPIPNINVPNIPNMGAAITPIQNLAKRVPDILMQGFAKILPNIAPAQPIAPKAMPIVQAQLKVPTPQDIMRHLTIPKDIIESLGPIRVGEALGDRLAKDHADAALDRAYAKSLRDRATEELQSIPDSKHLEDITRKIRFANNFFAIANLMDKLADAREAAITEINSPQPTDRNATPDKDQDKRQKEVTTRLDKAVKYLEMIAKKQGIEVELTDFA